MNKDRMVVYYNYVEQAAEALAIAALYITDEKGRLLNHHMDSTDALLITHLSLNKFRDQIKASFADYH